MLSCLKVDHFRAVKVLSLLFVIILQACGGGGGAAPSVVPPNPFGAEFAKVSSWHLRDDFAAQLFIGGDEILICDWATTGGSKPYALYRGEIIEKRAGSVRFKITYPDGRDFFYNATYDNSNLTLVADADLGSPTGYVRGDWQYSISAASMSSIGVPNSSGKTFECEFPLVELSTGWEGSNVDPATPITMRFDAPVNTDFSGMTATITANTGEVITLTPSYDPATMTLTLTPASQLQTLKGYTVSIDGLKDLDNNSWPVVQAMIWRFTTRFPEWRKSISFSGLVTRDELEFIGNKRDGRYVHDKVNGLLYDFDGNLVAVMNPNNPVVVDTPPPRNSSLTKVVGRGLETLRPDGTIERFEFPVWPDRVMDYDINDKGELVLIALNRDFTNEIATIYALHYDPVSRQWLSPITIASKSYASVGVNLWNYGVVSYAPSGEVLLMWFELLGGGQWTNSFVINAAVYENSGTGFVWNVKPASAVSGAYYDQNPNVWIRKKINGIGHLYVNGRTNGLNTGSAIGNLWGATYEIGKGWVNDGSQLISSMPGSAELSSDGSLHFLLVEQRAGWCTLEYSLCEKNILGYSRVQKNPDGSWSIIREDISLGYTAGTLIDLYIDSQGIPYTSWGIIGSKGLLYEARYLDNYGWTVIGPLDSKTSSCFPSLPDLKVADTDGSFYCAKNSTTPGQSELWLYE